MHDDRRRQNVNLVETSAVGLSDALTVCHDGWDRPNPPGDGKTVNIDSMRANGPSAGGDRVVYIVDDDVHVLGAIRRLIEEVNLPVQGFTDARSFLDAYSPDVCACLVLDVRLPGMSGTDLQRELQERDIRIPIIFITGHGDVPMAVEALKAGAVDFIEKPYRSQQLLDAVQKALAVDESRRRAQREQAELAERFERLTAREREVVELVARGKTNKDIAAMLGVTPQAIDARRARAMSKLGTQSVPELAQLVLRKEWTSKGRATPPPDES